LDFPVPSTRTILFCSCSPIYLAASLLH